MADNEQNDEYKLSEFDSINNESGENLDFSEPNSQTTTKSSNFAKKDIKRNAMVVLGLVLCIIITYKFIGGIFSGKNSAENFNAKALPAPTAKTMPKPLPIENSIQPVPQIREPIVVENNNLLKQKVDSIEISQQNLQTQVSTINDQLGTVSNNVTNLTAEMVKINQAMAYITNQINNQSEAINLLMERTKPKQIKHIIHNHNHADKVTKYYINAVIPGRAWLIGANGSTLSVRKGTKIPGYGLVTLVDAIEGRVLMSSGRTIKFSQEDS